MTAVKALVLGLAVLWSVGLPLLIIRGLNGSIERDLERIRREQSFAEALAEFRVAFVETVDRIVAAILPTMQAIADMIGRVVADVGPVIARFAEALQPPEGPLTMTDPLAHLYAETGHGLPDDEGPPIVETTLDALVADPGETEEVLSESDLDELALLVKGKLEAGGLPDEEAVELGLGTIEELAGADFDRELVLNSTGRAIVRRLIDSGYLGRFEAST